VDLVFADRDGHILLLEVKVGPDELDKAIGQILRHRYLYAQQNHISESSIRGVVFSRTENYIPLLPHRFFDVEAYKNSIICRSAICGSS
jgi:hypothetical protein